MGAGVGPADLDSAGAAAVLRQLDDLRERAFAGNDAALLARVYAPGPLLGQDTALLARLVPSGCGLVGMRTTYSQVEATPGEADTSRVTVTAVLAPSALICAGAQSGTAEGAGPTRLRIDLGRVDGAYLITGRQLVD
ncbi:MAG: hypothetical protein FWD74_08860 [Actinomycetia bacterium]|nr:hypothetical protein [Actinomycetes bacterium]